MTQIEGEEKKKQHLLKNNKNKLILNIQSWLVDHSVS